MGTQIMRAAENQTEPGRFSWLKRMTAWYRLKKLERELRRSENFQRQCEKLRCFTLVALEETERAKIRKKINQLEKSS
jgi:hypothetical protein